MHVSQHKPYLVSYIQIRPRGWIHHIQASCKSEASSPTYHWPRGLEEMHRQRNCPGKAEAHRGFVSKERDGLGWLSARHVASEIALGSATYTGEGYQSRLRRSARESKPSLGARQAKWFCCGYRCCLGSSHRSNSHNGGGLGVANCGSIFLERCRRKMHDFTTFHLKY